MNKKWVIKNGDKDLKEEISRKLNISSLLSLFLVNRGIETIEQADRFLRSGTISLADPYLLPDMEKSVDRIRRALKDNEKILIYGDSDVDGVTGTVIIKETLDNLGGRVFLVCLPDRGLRIVDRDNFCLCSARSNIDNYCGLRDKCY